MLDDGEGGKVRAAFSSYAAADACTLIQARRVLGEVAGLDVAARQAGLTVWDKADRSGLNPLIRNFTGPTGSTTKIISDVCVLEATPEAPDTAGLVLDYEVSDGRSPQDAVYLVKAVADLVHGRGKSLLMSTDPLPRPANGLTSESIGLIVNVVDGFIPVLSTGASLANATINYPPHFRQRSPEQAYAEQSAFLAEGFHGSLSEALRRKIIWNISLYDLSLAEAADLRAEIIRGRYGGLMVSRSFLREGGSCARPENQVIACLVKGACDGRYGLSR